CPSCLTISSNFSNWPSAIFWIIQMPGTGLWPTTPAKIPPAASRPRGWELAGIVEKPGDDTGRFKPGDEVFGMLHLSGDGADAEFAVGDEIDFALKPGGLDFPAAAAIPIGALTAYQALFD